MTSSLSHIIDGLTDPDNEGCGNCGGEGFVYGCSWDWQCDTYDEGEGTCLCTRPCDWCRPSPRNAELDAALKTALQASSKASDGEGGE